MQLIAKVFCWSHSISTSSQKRKCECHYLAMNFNNRRLNQTFHGSQSMPHSRQEPRPEQTTPNFLVSQQPSSAAAGSSASRSSSAQYWDTVLDPFSIRDAPRRHSDAAGPSTSSGTRVCPSCNERFMNNRIFECHVATCAGNDEKPFICEQCGTAFKKNSNLAKHMKLVHLGERNFPCTEPGCGRLFGQKSNLNSHVKAVHLGEKPFVCPDTGCGRRFSQKSGLKAHIKTVHNGERPYVCECGSSFGHRGDVSCKQFSGFHLFS